MYKYKYVSACACVRACVCACVRCVRACVCVCVCVCVVQVKNMVGCMGLIYIPKQIVPRGQFRLPPRGHKFPNDERNGVRIIVKSCHVNAHTCVGRK